MNLGASEVYKIDKNTFWKYNMCISVGYTFMLAALVDSTKFTVPSVDTDHL